MSIIELKETIHEGNQNIDDEKILLIVNDLILQGYQPGKEINLSNAQKSALNESEQDFLAGRVMARETAKQQVRDWLNQKKS